MIIDAHVHLSIYQGRGKSLKECLDILLTEMKKHGINYAIVIPDNIENDPNIAYLEVAMKLVKQTNNLFLLGSPQIIQRGNSEVGKYEQLLAQGIIKGIKFFPGHDPYFPIDERCLLYYEICQKLDVPVVFHTGENSSDPESAKYNDPKHIVEIAKKYPNLKIIITHYFFPKIEYCYEITKDVPNIYFELAGTADTEVLEKSGGIEKMRAVLTKTIYDRPNQVIFGTDWPMCSIEKHIALVKSLNLPENIEEGIFSKNAKTVYKLPV